MHMLTTDALILFLFDKYPIKEKNYIIDIKKLNNLKNGQH